MTNLRTWLVAAAVVGLAAPSFAASPPNALDLPPAGVTPPPVDMLQTAPAQQSAPERPRGLSGNPLWAIPLSSLSATRDRPLFTPSRRPPAPAAVAAPPPVAVAAPPPTGPERPQLTLVGAIVSDSGGIAIFIDQTTNEVVRLRTGDSHSGWRLKSVKGREAEFQRNSETLTLALPAPGALTPAAPPPPVPGVSPPVPSVSPSGTTQAPPGQALPPGWSRTPTGEIVNTE
jgi:general secretion pathway protein N